LDEVLGIKTRRCAEDVYPHKTRLYYVCEDEIMGGYVQAAMMVLGGADTWNQQRRESKSQKKEADLITEEGLAETARIRHEGEAFEANQRLSYLKNGVSLRGSPLLVLADTQAEVGKQAEANTRRTFAARKKHRTLARRARVKGRSGMLSSGSSGAGAATTQYRTDNPAPATGGAS
jgi:hypothetical protein